MRSLGGVSLFDFAGFDLESYGKEYPSSSWAYFVPVCTGCMEAIWIEIDRAAISPKFIDGRALLDRWHAEKAYAHTIMPTIETAHIGDLGGHNFLRRLAVNKLENGFSAEPLTT